jgi:phage repressor protein C with HTH and peptisase S24 domain
MLTKLFWCALMGSMQWNKASKKTRNIAEETQASAPETSAAAEITPNPRTTRSSKTKKTETTESGPMKHRHNKVNSAPPLDAVPAPPINARATAAAAGSGSIIVDAVGVMAPALEHENPTISAEVELPREVSREEIAKLAYSYWINRGHSHGGAEEDWLRAERELRYRR